MTWTSWISRNGGRNCTVRNNFYDPFPHWWWRIMWGRFVCYMAEEHNDKWNNGDVACIRCGRYKYDD